MANEKHHKAKDDLPNAIVNAPTTFITTNLSLAIIDTEYAHTLPAGTVGFIVKARLNTATLKINLGSTAAQSGITYFTVVPDSNFNSGDLNTGEGEKIYIQSDIVTTAEIITF